MDRSRGAARTRVTLPTPRVEPVEPPTGRELEVKFKTDAAGLKLALRSELLAIETADAPRRTLRSVYFDTSAGDLRKQRMVLRVRKVRNTHIMGLKGARPLADVPFSRSEMEACVPSLDPDITLFGEEIAAELSRVIEGRLLEQKFETQIKRRLRCLNLERSQIEVAFDEGFVVAGDRRQPFTEIELELKAGEETALYDLAVHLADALPMQLEIMSKAERGFMLAADDHPMPVRAEALKFPADATLDVAVEIVINGALGQFVANWPALTETHHRESIHQMRVALRRLRTALSFVNRVLPCAEFEIFRAEAKQISSALGPARNWDAFQELIEVGPLRYYARDEGFEALLTAVEERRSAAYAIAQEVIEDPSTTRFVLKLRAFLAHRAWRSALSGAELLRLTEPVKVFAGETLERLHKRSNEAGGFRRNRPMYDTRSA